MGEGSRAPLSAWSSSPFEEVTVVVRPAQGLSAIGSSTSQSCDTKAKARAAKKLLNTDAT